MFRLLSYDTVPPGGYPYVQPGDKSRNFPAQPSIEAQAKIVQSYRKGNGLPRASYKECLTDVDHYVATEALSGNPRFTVKLPEDNPEAIAAAGNAPGITPCIGCGVPV